jgi:hypothetical protein
MIASTQCTKNQVRLLDPRKCCQIRKCLTNQTHHLVFSPFKQINVYLCASYLHLFEPLDDWFDGFVIHFRPRP